MIAFHCAVPGCTYTAMVRDQWHAQDALVSHHNVEHGRPQQGTWPVYEQRGNDEPRPVLPPGDDPRAGHPLRLEPVEHDYGPNAGNPFRWLVDTIRDVLVRLLTPSPRGYRPTSGGRRPRTPTNPPTPPAGPGGGSR